MKTLILSVLTATLLTACGVKGIPVHPEADPIPFVYCSPYQDDCDQSMNSFDPDFDPYMPNAEWHVPLVAKKRKKIAKKTDKHKISGYVPRATRRAKQRAKHRKLIQERKAKQEAEKQRRERMHEEE